jgi:hypothetical protein
LVLVLDFIPLANPFQHLLKNGTLVIDGRRPTFLAGSHRLVGANLIGGDFAQLCFPKRLTERAQSATCSANLKWEGHWPLALY